MGRIFVLCEGESEKLYLQYLNIILQNQYDADLIIVSRCFKGGGVYKALTSNLKRARNKLKEVEKKFGPNDFLYIWLDYDCFMRDYPENLEEFQNFVKSIKLGSEFKILWNYMNFEDFLILHYDATKIAELQDKLYNTPHFTCPLHSEEYLPVYCEIIPEYRKAKLPNDLVLDMAKIKNCIINIENTDYEFRSDISEILKLVVQKCDN